MLSDLQRASLLRVPNADALAWEQRLVVAAFVELGAIRIGG